MRVGSLSCSGRWPISNVAILLVVFELTANSKVNAAAKMYTDRIAYQVYAAVLESNKRFADARLPLIRGGTVSCPRDCLPASKYGKALLQPAIENFKKINRRHWELMRSIELSKSYKLVPEREFAHGWIKSSSVWRTRLQQEPKFAGFFELSAVGFNESKTIAVVYVASNCGALCANGDVLVLLKVDRIWKLLEVLCFWKS